MKQILLALLSITTIAIAKEEQPNIILIMADDQGWGDVGYHGHPHLKTPNIDKLANSGIKLERFYAQSAVCSPTRGSTITGRHPNRYGILHANVGKIPTKEQTIGEIALLKGYATGHFGKWHLGTLSNTINDANRGKQDSPHYSPPWKNGFQTCYSTESKVPTWDPMKIPEGQKSKKFWNPTTKDQPSKFYGTHYWTETEKPIDPTSKALEGCDSKIIMDQALKFIETNASNKKPFLTVIWFHAPHWPVVAGPKYQELYNDRSDFEKNYWGCITALDDQVGRLTNTLEKHNLQNTIILYASDNGPEGRSQKQDIGSAANLTGRKRSLKEGGIRVPGFIHWPAKIKTPRAINTVTCTTDYLPTITEILNSHAPEILDGTSLLPIINGEATTRKKPLGFAFQKQIAWMDGDYKAYSKTGNIWELYNITQDPSEQQNLAQKHPIKLEALKQAALTWKNTL